VVRYLNQGKWVHTVIATDGGEIPKSR